jgi:hypothetical protein
VYPNLQGLNKVREVRKQDAYPPVAVEQIRSVQSEEERAHIGMESLSSSTYRTVVEEDLRKSS